MNRYQFVDDHQRRHGVKRLCDTLGLARSSFYHWRPTAAARAARQAVEAGLAARIRKAHQDSDGTYGAPRITAELRDEGGPAVNHKRVARIMRTIGLEGVRLRRRHRTTVADQAASKAPDSPTCRSAARSRSISRPSSTSPHAGWPGGPSPTTCGRNSSSTP